MSDTTVFKVGNFYSHYEYLPNGELDCISMKTVKFRTNQSILTSDGKVFRVFVSDNCEHAVPYSFFNNGTVIKASDIIKPADTVIIDSDFIDAFLTELNSLSHNKTGSN